MWRRGGQRNHEATGTTEATATTGATKDLLSAIEEEGVLTVSTDPAYPPQSSLNEETGEYEGFDIDVATAIAEPTRGRSGVGGAGLGDDHRR